MMMQRFWFLYFFMLWHTGNFLLGQSFNLYLQQKDISKIEYHQEDALIKITLQNGQSIGYDGLEKIDASDRGKTAQRNYSIPVFDANAVTSFNQKSNSAPKPIVVPENINAAIQLDDGSIFIGTEKGIFISENDYPQLFYHPLIEDIDAITGVYYFAPYLFFQSPTGKLILWNQSNNDISTLNGPKQSNDLLLDPYGMLWVANEEGLHGMLLQEELSKEAPKIIFQIVEINGKVRPFETDISISTKDHVKILLRARHSARPEDIRFTYKLVQQNQYPNGDLIAPQLLATSDPFVSYTNLEEGSYIFKGSTTVDGKYFSHLPDVHIHVIKEEWPIWLFIAGGLGLLLLILLLNAKSRYDQFAKDIKGQRDRLILENQSLKYQQKALQLQMNPHFIFNVLNSIQGLIAKGDNAASRSNLNKFSQLMRMVLDQSRDEYISLEEEIKYLQYYLSLEQMCRADLFDYKINVDPDIDLSIQILPMIIQPFVENAIIHAFNGIDHKGHIDITFKESENKIIAFVKDNGIGLGTSPSSHRSHGIDIVNERLQKAFKDKNAHVKLQSSGMQKEAGSGTTVRIELPIY